MKELAIIEALLSKYSLQWLAAAILLFIFYCLLKIGVVFSEITKTGDGKLEGVSRTVSPHLLFDDKTDLGVKYKKHQIDQKLYAVILNGLSRIVIVVALLASSAFVVTLVWRPLLAHT